MNSDFALNGSKNSLNIPPPQTQENYRTIEGNGSVGIWKEVQRTLCLFGPGPLVLQLFFHHRLLTRGVVPAATSGGSRRRI